MSKFEGTRKALNNASTGLAVAVAFVNVALLLVKLVQTVSEELPALESEGEDVEEIES
jgi:hypothetical protein